jgi:hypothetical protein
LDDLSSNDLDEEAVMEDEEAIDLVDLVEKGDEKFIKQAESEPFLEDSGSAIPSDLELRTEEFEEIEDLSSDGDSSKEADVLDLSDITLELNQAESPERRDRGVPEENEITEAELEDLLAEESGETVRLDLDSKDASRAAGEREEASGETDLESLLVEELEEEKEAEEKDDLATEAMTVKLEGESLLAEDGAGFKAESPLRMEETEDLTKSIASVEELPGLTEEEEPTEMPVAPELAGISEEKLEEVITRVVENVVERVARETMVNVAEKLITEAIEALKRSIESNSRG